jgi:hypothetical protein
VELSSVYPWIVLVHVISVLGFLAAHGVSMAVVFRLRSERDLGRVRALLDLSAASLGSVYLFVLVVLLSGIVAGIVGGWWTSGRLWIWASLILLIGIAVYMSYNASDYFNELRRAAGLAGNVRGKAFPAGEPDSARLGDVLGDRRAAWEFLAIGGGGLVVLTWLMMLKPF